MDPVAPLIQFLGDGQIENYGISRSSDRQWIFIQCFVTSVRIGPSTVRLLSDPLLTTYHQALYIGLTIVLHFRKVSLHVLCW
jgi:hypothetical protein